MSTDYVLEVYDGRGLAPGYLGSVDRGMLPVDVLGTTLGFVFGWALLRSMNDLIQQIEGVGEGIKGALRLVLE